MNLPFLHRHPLQLQVSLQISQWERFQTILHPDPLQPSLQDRLEQSVALVTISAHTDLSCLTVQFPPGPLLDKTDVSAL
jgi:hypothetical protein